MTHQPKANSISRAEQIATGELINLTTMAKGYRIPYPLAVTQAAWSRCIFGHWMRVTRLRADALLRGVVRASRRHRDDRTFTLRWLVPTPAGEPARVSLTVERHLGDEFEAVITIRLTDEPG